MAKTDLARIPVHASYGRSYDHTFLLLDQAVWEQSAGRRAACPKLEEAQQLHLQQTLRPSQELIDSSSAACNAFAS